MSEKKSEAAPDAPDPNGPGGVFASGAPSSEEAPELVALKQQAAGRRAEVCVFKVCGESIEDVKRLRRLPKSCSGGSSLQRLGSETVRSGASKNSVDNFDAGRT